jgi:hypothetical protein
MVPFSLSYVLTRRQRLAVELMPWLPAVAGTLGFGTGAAYLSLWASPWFACLLIVPLVAYRGLFAFVFDLVVRGGHSVQVVADESLIIATTRSQQLSFTLEGIFQVYREGDVWTVLHLGGNSLTIPTTAISESQIAYLRTFVRKQAALRDAR